MGDSEPMSFSSWIFSFLLMKEDFGEEGLWHCIQLFQRGVWKLNAYRGLAGNSNKSHKLRVRNTWPQPASGDNWEEQRLYKPSTVAECCLEGCVLLSIVYSELCREAGAPHFLWILIIFERYHLIQFWIFFFICFKYCLSHYFRSQTKSICGSLICCFWFGSRKIRGNQSLKNESLQGKFSQKQNHSEIWWLALCFAYKGF